MSKREGGPIPFDTQMVLWGYAVGGDILDRVACIAEGHAIPNRDWDRTAADLATQRIDHGDGWVQVPEWWALPWVTDLLIWQETGRQPKRWRSTDYPLSESR